MGALEVPLTSEETREAHRICKAAGFAESVVDARLNVDMLPEQITGRECVDSLNDLADHIQGAANKLSNLPILARARLESENPGGWMPTNYAGPWLSIPQLAQTLRFMAIISRAAGKRVDARGGRPFEYRRVYAISQAAAICRKYELVFSATTGPAIDIVNLVLREEISVDQFNRAIAHMRKPTKKK